MRPFAPLFRSSPSFARGFGLLGIILVVALSSVVVGVGYTVYQQGNQGRQVNQERDRALQLNNAIQTSYASAANYNGLTQTRALQDKIFDKSMLDATGTPVNTWGGPVLVTAMDVEGVAGRGFAITHEKVPTSACTRFATQGAPGFADTLVNGQTIMSAHAPQVQTASTLCAQSDANVVQFRQVKSAATAAANPELTPLCEQPDQTQKVSCPADHLSSIAPYGADGITQTRSSFCNSAYGAMAWNPWKTVSDTCVPACHAPASVPGSQTAACPAGQVTIVGGNASFTQSNLTTYSCGTPVGPVNPSTSPWTPVASAVCAPKCVPPASQTQMVACPAGQAVPGPFPANYNGVAQRRDGTCPNPTGAGTYGGWYETGRSCAAVCAAKAPTARTEYSSSTVNAGCPGGYTGSHTYVKQIARNITTNYACASVTGNSYNTSDSVGGWYDTGAILSDSNTCTPATPPHYVQTAAGCSYTYNPSGGVGAFGGCSNRAGQYVDITSNAYWSWFNPNWESNMPANPPLCSADDLIQMTYYGRNINCTTGKSSGNPPASCSVGQTFFYGGHSVSLDCGQSGSISECQLAESYNYTEYACQQ